ncbi:MAG: hypothetical protein Q8K86_05765 [Candidatus Nanopelagicaceae bacterium]|nr:hypothetical protein [Candidatus Nanopelagicaceae bacterium]
MTDIGHPRISGDPTDPINGHIWHDDLINKMKVRVGGVTEIWEHPGPTGPTGIVGPTGPLGLTGPASTVTGPTGPYSGNAQPYVWDTNTVDSDPGAGRVKGNNGPGMITKIWINYNNSNGNLVSDWVESLDDSTSQIKGLLRIANYSNLKWTIYKLTAVTDKVGYYELDVIFVNWSGIGPGALLNDEPVIVSFAPSGDSSTQLFIFDSENGDYLNVSTVSGSDVYAVLKPYMLRRTPFDGLTRDGIYYTYLTDNERTAENAGSETEDQVIVPSYVAGDEILAVWGIVDGYPLVDLNVDARAWAKKDV